MAIELYSYTGQQLADEVTQKFGDIGMVQISTAMLLKWINNGQRKIANDTPFVEGSAATSIIAGQSPYDLATLFTSSRIQSINSITVNGVPIEIVPFARYQKFVPNGPVGSANSPVSGVPTMGTIWGSVLSLYPIPNLTVANNIVVYFHAFPADLATLANPLTVPDRYFNALVEYVFAQSLLMDENFAAAEQMFTHHESSLARQATGGASTPTEFYSSVTLDPYDNDAVY